MAVWSKALLLTACYLSPLPRFESPPGHVRKLPVTAVVFDGYSGFLHFLKLASHKIVTIGINVTKNEIRNFYLHLVGVPYISS